MTDPSSPPLSNPLVRLTGYHLRRASISVASDLGKRLDPLGLTVVSLSVLILIEANPGVSQSRLSGVLAIKRANMAPLTALFLARGWVIRDRAVGRSQGLRLTEAGQDLAKQAWSEVEANEARFFTAHDRRLSADLERLATPPQRP